MEKKYVLNVDDSVCLNATQIALEIITDNKATILSAENGIEALQMLLAAFETSGLKSMQSFFKERIFLVLSESLVAPSKKNKDKLSGDKLFFWLRALEQGKASPEFIQKYIESKQNLVTTFQQYRDLLLGEIIVDHKKQGNKTVPMILDTGNHLSAQQKVEFLAVNPLITKTLERPHDLESLRKPINPYLKRRL